MCLFHILLICFRGPVRLAVCFLVRPGQSVADAEPAQSGESVLQQEPEDLSERHGHESTPASCDVVHLSAFNQLTHHSLPNAHAYIVVSFSLYVDGLFEILWGL